MVDDDDEIITISAKGDARILSYDELDRIRKACKQTRDLAVFEFLRSTGCRVNEMLHVEMKDIDLKNGKVKIRKSKITVAPTGEYAEINGEMKKKYRKYRKERYSHLDEECVHALTLYLNSSKYKHLSKSKNARLFSIGGRMVRYIIRRVCDDAGLDSPHEIHPHILRHTLATHLLKEGMPVQRIKQALGWSPSSKTFDRVYDGGNIDDYIEIYKRLKGGDRNG